MANKILVFDKLAFDPATNQFFQLIFIDNSGSFSLYIKDVLAPTNPSLASNVNAVGATPVIAPSGVGNVNGVGTTGVLPLWTDGPNSIIGDSLLAQSAGNIFVLSGDFTVSAGDMNLVDGLFTVGSTSAAAAAQIIQGDGQGTFLGSAALLALVKGAGDPWQLALRTTTPINPAYDTATMYLGDDGGIGFFVSNGAGGFTEVFALGANPLQATCLVDLTVTTGVIVSGITGVFTGSLQLANAGSAFLTTIEAGEAFAARTYVWPTDFGAAGAALTDAAGDGVLSWVVPGSFTGLPNPYTQDSGSSAAIYFEYSQNTPSVGRWGVENGTGGGTIFTGSATDAIVFGARTDSPVQFFQNDSVRFEFPVGGGTLVNNVGNDSVPLTLKTNGSPGNYTPANGAIFIRDAAGGEICRIFASDPDEEDYNSANLYIGYQAGLAQPTDNVDAGYGNTGIGYRALKSITLGAYNFALGFDVLSANTSGSSNIAVGVDTLVSNVDGSENLSLGQASLHENISGIRNIALGGGALYASLSSNNVAAGCDSGGLLETGQENVFIGANSGNTEGQKIDARNSIAIGANAFTTADNQTVLGNSSTTEAVIFGALKTAKATVAPQATTPIAVAAEDSLTHYTNEGAVALGVFNLPAAAPGLTYTFIVQDADGIQIKANGTDMIQIGAAASSAGGTATSTVIGSSVTLVAINASQWFAREVTGTWITA